MKYDDIIHLPHHVSTSRARMTLENRAAQFAPFAGLTGYDAAIKETRRLTEVRMEIDESRKRELNEKLRILEAACGRNMKGRNSDTEVSKENFPEITVIYFVPDEKKTGGAYVSISGEVKKLDPYAGRIILTDEQEIPREEIVEITGKLFEAMDNV